MIEFVQVCVRFLVLSSSSPSPYQVYELTVVGLAFLWHQIRCMVTILFLIGNGLEKPEVCVFVCDSALIGVHRFVHLNRMDNVQ